MLRGAGCPLEDLLGNVDEAQDVGPVLLDEVAGDAGIDVELKRQVHLDKGVALGPHENPIL